MEKTVYSLCFMCSVRCPIKVTVKDGQVTFIEGNPQVPGIEGSLCPRGSAGIALLYDAERLQSPMIRTGERGSGQWRKASWDEALDTSPTSSRRSSRNTAATASLWPSGPTSPPT